MYFISDSLLFLHVQPRDDVINDTSSVRCTKFWIDPHSPAIIEQIHFQSKFGYVTLEYIPYNPTNFFS